MSEKRKFNRKRWAVGGLLVLLAGVAALVFASNGRKADETYRTEKVSRGDIVMNVYATGSLSAKTTVQVGSQVSGIVSELHADFNTPVKKGQVLAKLDPTPILAQLEQRTAELTRSRIQVDNARSALARQQKLLDQGLTSEAEYEAARASFQTNAAQLEQSQAALEQARANLEYTNITSPVDGVVVARQYDVGQTVAASFQAPTLFTIAEDLTKMQLQADIDQSDIGRLREGQTAKFTVDAYPDQEFKGRISQIRLNATANQNVITYPVIIEVENPELQLRPQMTANVTIEVARAADVLRVSNSALRFQPESDSPQPAASGATRSRRGAVQEQAVYKLGQEGKRERVTIQPGLTDGRFTAVAGGALREGETVVTGMASAQTAAATQNRLPGTGGGRGRR